MKTRMKFLALMAIVLSVALFTGCEDRDPYDPPQTPGERQERPIPDPMDDAL